MKAIVIAALAATGVVSAWAEAAKPAVKISKENRLRVAQLHRRIDGGIVPKVGTGNGYVAIVNASGYDNSVCVAVGEALSREHRLYVSNFVGTAASPSPAAMVVLTSSGGPMLSLNPDTRIATVSLAALKPGADEAVLKERVRKSLKRAFGYAVGAGVSGNGENLMKPIRTLAELDRLSYRSPLDIESALIQNVDLGLSIFTPISYRDACREGCAPAPANEIQKAIWEREKNKKDDATDPTNRWKRDFPDKENPKTK